MYSTYRKHRFCERKMFMIKNINAIIAEYEENYISITLRQLYYQLVARGYIPNKVSEYKKLVSLVRDGRYAGVIDWEAIEDRVRVPQIASRWNSVSDFVQTVKGAFRLDRWDGQKYYVELFTEKDALSSILAPIADKWQIPFCVNRGYGSTTAMWDLSNRIDRSLAYGAWKAVIIYIGDFDPSGIDMVRDIEDRIREFLGDKYDSVAVLPIALTLKQIKKYKPPPNPAKVTDPRAKGYIKAHGKTSWEVDALKPSVLTELVNKVIGDFVDEKKMANVIGREKDGQKRIAERLKGLG